MIIYQLHTQSDLYSNYFSSVIGASLKPVPASKWGKISLCILCHFPVKMILIRNVFLIPLPTSLLPGLASKMEASESPTRIMKSGRWLRSLVHAPTHHIQPERGFWQVGGLTLFTTALCHFQNYTTITGQRKVWVAVRGSASFWGGKVCFHHSVFSPLT